MNPQVSTALDVVVVALQIHYYSGSRIEINISARSHIDCRASLEFQCVIRCLYQTASIEDYRQIVTFAVVDAIVVFACSIDGDVVECERVAAGIIAYIAAAGTSGKTNAVAQAMPDNQKGRS